MRKSCIHTYVPRHLTLYSVHAVSRFTVLLVHSLGLVMICTALYDEHLAQNVFIPCCACWCRYQGRSGLVPAYKLRPSDPNNPANVRWPVLALHSHWMITYVCTYVLICIHTYVIVTGPCPGTMVSVKSWHMCLLDDVALGSSTVHPCVSCLTCLHFSILFLTGQSTFEGNILLFAPHHTTMTNNGTVTVTHSFLHL